MIIPINKLIIKNYKSAVSVSVQLAKADWLDDKTRAKLADIHRSKISKDGLLTIRSDKTRTKTLNIADCMDRLRCYISEAQQPPKPELILPTIESTRKQLEQAAALRLRVNN